jgi:hypothetical protein
VGSLSQAGGSGGVDAGLSLLASAEVASWLVVHGMLFGTVTSGLSSAVPLQPRTWHGGVDVSLAALVGPVTLLLEDRFLSALMEGGWTSLDGGDDGAFLSSPYASLFRPHNQVTFGLRWWKLTASFSEDFTPGSNPRGARSWFYDENAPDTVFAFTWATRL